MNKLIFLMLFIMAFSCVQDSGNSLEELFKVDREFSLASENLGYNKAFIDFAHEDAVLLRDDNYPLEGKTALMQIFESADTEGVSFTWQPKNGNIAKSGDLGYTYGVYQFKKDSVIEKGTYVSIWKKNKKGEWKYILDSGNEGLGEK